MNPRASVVVLAACCCDTLGMNKACLLVLLVGCGASPGANDASVVVDDAGFDSGVADAGAPVDAGDFDAGDFDAGGSIDAGAVSDAGVCTAFDGGVTCAHRTRRYQAGLESRAVHFALPTGVAPAAGWPTVFLFQGSFFSAALSWSANTTTPFNGLHQTRTIQLLLEAGFAVLAPEAQLNGSTYWDTNQPLYALSWESAPDHTLMLALFAAITAGDFGPLDGNRLYATGISSGGYMTSRMALSYPGKFRALAVDSASWATCSGALCVLPARLPMQHPPTLFLHGAQDLVVPVASMRPYAAALTDAGIEARVVIDPTADHQWLDVAPEETRAWFVAH